ncbi:carbon-nitrogen family hydrolase [Saccharibacillus sp. CPCC 101409]|uniref:carbon-nitrogen family hydrolase n=1 Tax=Saccharibacillus sp. CPCC 101409 TaxID=3058041 RepID=UPI00267359EC|nr:carbon-nitrogen family hydrolase [Saccharibacillus sp. CPCC 101409]MDO3408298.1 carbon-nitrogen family hydrolase [Saccharibacillus sp. CPCC 101409]
MAKWKITCIQHNVIFGNPEANYKAFEQQIETAMKGGPDILVLPELWTTGYDLERLNEIAEDDAARSKAFLAELARKHNVHLIGGSAAKRTEEGVFNTLLAYDREGRQIAEYNKAHLFQLMDEHLHLQAGRETGDFELDGVKTAGVICYDIRFPEWIRLHAAAGAEVLFVVAQWPVERLSHWRALLTARAIENQCWVVGCNRSGTDPDHDFAGSSMIINPLGDIVAEAGKNDELLSAEIDTSETAEARGHIPVFEDRRTELYR